MFMSWHYFTLGADGYLYDEEGTRQFSRTFANASEADLWLESEDIRGSVK